MTIFMRSLLFLTFFAALPVARAHLAQAALTHRQQECQACPPPLATYEELLVRAWPSALDVLVSLSATG